MRIRFYVISRPITNKGIVYIQKLTGPQVPTYIVLVIDATATMTDVAVSMRNILQQRSPKQKATRNAPSVYPAIVNYDTPI